MGESYMIEYLPTSLIFNIDISAIDFSQTFEEHSYSNKTLQIKNMFEQSLINKANPANFGLTFPAIREADLQILFNRALDYKTFDLYIIAGNNLFKVSNCVVTNAAFIIQRDRPLAMTISGEGTKVSTELSIPGVLQPRSGTRTYNRVQYLNVILGKAGPKDSIIAITINLETEIQWIPYTGVSDAIKALEEESLMFPTAFVVRRRNLSGSFALHELVEEAFYIDDTLIIEAGQQVGNTLYGFKFDIDNISHTNRINTGEIFSQQYTWRMTQNPDSLGEVISYIGFPDSGRAIQDNLDLDILDWLTNPILESP